MLEKVFQNNDHLSVEIESGFDYSFSKFIYFAEILNWRRGVKLQNHACYC